MIDRCIKLLKFSRLIFRFALIIIEEIFMRSISAPVVSRYNVDFDMEDSCWKTTRRIISYRQCSQVHGRYNKFTNDFNFRLSVDTAL